MAKKNKKNVTTYKYGDGSPVSVISEHYRKGKLRCKNKKQKAIMIGACTHHILNKNGKAKPKWNNNGRGQCYCPICRKSWSTKMYNDDKLAQTTDKIAELNNQSKMLVQAMGADKQTIRFFSEFGSMVELYPRLYKRIRKVALKSDNVRRKKKKKGGDNGGSTFPAWG